MKVAVTGATGRLGKVLVDNYGYDIFDWQKRKDYYDVVVHTLAYTDVDGAETDVAECIYWNVLETNELRRTTNSKIIYLSTDFIFDGVDGYYSEQASPHPLSVYGMTKLLGEKCLYPTDLIVRTTVLYGGHKPDFVTWVLDELKKGDPLRISVGYFTTPTNVYHLAEAINWLIENPIQHSVINVACCEYTSRFSFAVDAARIFGVNWHNIYGKNGSFGVAPRPKNGGLDVSLALSLGVPIYSVREGLKLMKEMKNA